MQLFRSRIKNLIILICCKNKELVDESTPKGIFVAKHIVIESSWNAH